MLRSGVLTGATLKALIKVREADEEDGSDDSEADVEAQPQNARDKTPGGPTKKGDYEEVKNEDDDDDNEGNGEDKELALLTSKNLLISLIVNRCEQAFPF